MVSSDFFKTFISENLALIRSICRAYARDEEELKDLIQEVSFQLWKSHQSFKGNSQVSTWVYRVTLNVCLSQSRRTKKELLTYSLDQVKSMEEVTEEEREEIEILYKAIRKLKESERAMRISA